ncbi:N utilization substance protein B [Enterococcus sp. PF1-24]|uniref:transcription antitermination factor NusB n=1 Tax=unclassified Enterococcus TaxID=2608891 RepID=UPI0024732547|nr:MULTISPECIES: transcription antitermination factor NusB [unclassified Enterococcus]MDH6364429.1 N utilization substance protein B [Enterococcus sp. PFB1-1]MDH6401548.1 N utilization substance protein B [Enterococcus sp. PF1-24]
MTKELSRHEIREKALQALFPLDFNADLSKQDAIFNAIELDHQELLNEEEDSFIPAYLDLLVGGVLTKQAEIDERIQGHLKNKWSIQRIAKLDLVILRIALFEIFYVDDVPNTVAVNEAIELAKTFSDDQSRKFVNGVLSNVVKEIEA